MERKEGEASPSRVIKLGSDDEVELDDQSEEFNTSKEETMVFWNAIGHTT